VPNNIVIGKRVTFGSIVGGIVSVGVWMWNVTNPDKPIPAEQALFINTVFVGIGQIIIANVYGVTTGEPE